uniref:Odorant receptor n=1 Tax=Anomala corpulenta TaxID=931571 RepID=A0A0E3U361_9SCAR|nr:odorant receptor 11 [Anomala corpulenta]
MAFYKISIKTSLTMLNLKGLNPLISTRSSNTRAITFLLTEVLATITVASSLFTKTLEADSVVDNISGIVFSIQTICKEVTMLLCRDEFVALLNYVEEFWPVNEFGIESGTNIRNIQKSTSKALKIFRCLLLMCTVIIISEPFFAEGRQFPVSWIDISCIQTSLICYGVIYGFLCGCTIGLVIFLSLIDGLFFNLLSYGYCELEQVKYALFNLSIDGDVRGDQVETLREIAVLVRHHVTSLEYVQRVKKLMSKVMLYQFSSSLFTLCTGLYVLTYQGFPPSVEAAVKFVPFVACAAFQIFAYCVAGQKISEQTESIANAAYECRWWFKHQPRLQRSICLIIQRSHRRIVLSAGGLWNLDMDTFIRILKASFSLLTFMQTMYIPE